VSVSWDRSGTDAAAILTITWRELGGPPVAARVPSGYGSSLICNLIPHELGGVVDLTFPCDGVSCKIKIPLRAGAKIPLSETLRRAVMDEDVLNTSIRKFLKRLGVTAQREIEKAVREADAARRLGGAPLPARAVVTVGGIDLKVEIDGDIELG
jgi:hypothetical protein